MHLMDPASGIYNRHLQTEDLCWVPGYRRMQGIVHRPGDDLFEGKSAEDALRCAAQNVDCVMINRNNGSGTRILIDKLLAGSTPTGYAVQPKSHNAVAAAVAQGRADWGIAIETVALRYGLGFIPVQDEHYDFMIPANRTERPAVRAFCQVLGDAEVREGLRLQGFGVI
jgi:putative molybdopterin biosynthesis protein